MHLPITLMNKKVGSGVCNFSSRGKILQGRYCLYDKKNPHPNATLHLMGILVIGDYVFPDNIIYFLK